MFEVYDAALGAPLGGGGRYDDLLGRFGRALPAVGWALNVERLHIALVGERARGAAARSARCDGPRRIAVPRGALFGDDARPARPRSASTPREVRANDRKLLFEDAGLVTMRPSDVPTYVEAGAADLGITGKDVLAEQSERAVYELLDLGYGPCVMVVRHRRRATTARPRRCAASA